MDLYKSFGNPLEPWVTESPQGRVALEGQWERGDSGDSLTLSGTTFMSKTDVGTLMRSDTEDSGVEICSEASLPSSPVSVSMGNTDIDPTFRDEDGLPSTSAPCFPVLSLPSSCSSSSLSLCSKAQQSRELAAVMHLKVEQALRRADSGDRDAVPRQRCHTASLPSPHSVTHIQRAGHRSGSVGLRSTVSQSVVDEQALTDLLQHRGLSPHHKTLPAPTDTEIREKDVCEGEYEGLTPGLGYLEQLCRMLEEIARLQIRNQGLQVEMEALREQLGSQNSERNQFDFKTSEEGGPSANERLEVKGYEDLPYRSSQNNSNVHQHFRRRSASDTTLMVGHLKKVKEVSEGRYLSTEDLFEQPEDDKNQEKEEAGKKEQGRRTKTWKLKSGSLRREETTEETSQQMNSSVKKASRRWLGQLFRKRKTVPE